MKKKSKEDPRKGRRAFQALFSRVAYNDEIIASLEVMTKRGLFTEWLRDMWLLWKTLANSDTSVLVKLFPNMVNRLTTVEGDALLQTIYEQNAEQIRLLNELKAMGVNVVATTPAAPVGLKPLSNLKPVIMPTFDDKDDDDNATVIFKTDANAGATNTDNFLDAMLKLQ